MTRCFFSSVKDRQLRKIHNMLFTALQNCYLSNYTTEALIRQNTEMSRDHMTPEIVMHLITRRCKLWFEKGDNSPFVDPFWAFYWPGGQVLSRCACFRMLSFCCHISETCHFSATLAGARFILDNPSIFKGETVLDVGSGCGASAIAAKLAGAARLIANDTDQVAIAAVRMNARANGVSIETDNKNMIGQINPDWTTILLGDMFYDEIFRDGLVSWLTKQHSEYRTSIFIGDPGRLPLTHHPIKKSLVKVAEYELPENCCLENNGLSTGYVWKLGNG